MKMISKFVGLFVVLGGLFLSGCSPVTVPPAHKGKFLTPSGYQPEVLNSGKYWEGMREDLVLIETGTNTYKETVEVKLKDKLTLTIDVRFRGRIAGDDDTLTAMFNDIDTQNKSVIRFSDVYGVYGKQSVREITRSVVSQYTVDEVHLNYSRLGEEISRALEAPLSATPIDLSKFTIGNIDYPRVVNEAIEAAEERRLAIAKEEAQAEIEMTKKRNEQRLAEANYEVEMTKARAVRDANKILAEGVTPELLELKRLEYMQTLADKANGNSTIYVPTEFGGNVGLDVKMFGNKQ